ncbi:MAG: homocysteine S-methyltransferase family protein [Thermoanaerobaculales bacterium]
MTPHDLTRWLEGGPRILDGAMASELLRRGVDAAAKLWGVGALLEVPAAVRALHRAYAAADADALTAATFRVAPFALRRAGIPDQAASLARLAVQLAREGGRGAGREPFVFAAQTTLEDCYRPDLVPDDATIEREHTDTAQLLASAQPDALLLETFNTVREARIAAAAAAATGLPVIVSFTCTSSGRLLSGEDAAHAAAAVTLPGVVAVGANCTACAALPDALDRLAVGTRLPLVAYANNAFFADDSAFLAADPLSPQEFAEHAAGWVAAGAMLVGGCCGTGPAHIRALSSRFGHPG